MSEEVRATLLEMVKSIPEPLLEKIEVKFREILEETLEEWKWEEYYRNHKEEFKRILEKAKEELRRGEVSDLSEVL